RENDPTFFPGNRCQLSGHGFALFLSHSASQHDHVTNSLQSIGEAVEMFVSFCKYERRAACLDGFGHILADAAIPCVVADQLAIERMKLDSLVRRRRHYGLE